MIIRELDQIHSGATLHIAPSVQDGCVTAWITIPPAASETPQYEGERRWVADLVCTWALRRPDAPGYGPTHKSWGSRTGVSVASVTESTDTLADIWGVSTPQGAAALIERVLAPYGAEIHAACEAALLAPERRTERCRSCWPRSAR